MWSALSAPSAASTRKCGSKGKLEQFLLAVGPPGRFKGVDKLVQMLPRFSAQGLGECKRIYRLGFLLPAEPFYFAAAPSFPRGDLRIPA